jgi:DNA-binding transcriptional regulator PaaX
MANLNLPFELQTFTIKEVGILLSAHPNTIRRYLDQKRLEGIKIGEGEIRISGSSVVKMIEEGKLRYSRETNKVGFALTKQGQTKTVKSRAASVLERLGLKRD